MVVCKFFQQGSCRYGQNCRFDHIYGSKYSYYANAQAEPTQAVPAVTDEQLNHQVLTDLQSLVRGGQWLLSSYAPFKEKQTFPGLIDMSPEEARLLIYEAKANNTLDQAVSYMNSLFQDAKQKYELLLSKNTSITKVLRSIYNGQTVATPFGNPQSSEFGNSNASSLFRSAVQPTPSVFQNNTPSVFAQTNSFATNDPAKSIFAQASQSTFQNQSPSVFGLPSQLQQSMFAQPTPAGQETNAQSIFAQASQNAFSQSQPTPNMFNSQNAQNTAANIFAQASASQSVFAQPQPTTPFSQPNVYQNPPNQVQSGFGVSHNVVAPGVYSQMEDLSPEDLEAYNSPEFKMGFIPMVPPPQSLCISSL